ncbi:MAG TPA: RDD family protein [Actinophytocola sp.]|uniref:RDD family protein n=1 Tax=Actinophytocola sp. TaxID=1872138 RepID=UPI002DBC8A0C|nr:RDD family protein [Actinophytocola sp.]HEU5472645.1 RDD family protein [Actinophytocola sp.]
MRRAAPSTAPAPDRTAGIVTRLLAAVIDAAVIGAVSGLLYLGVSGLVFMLRPGSFSWPQPDLIVSLPLLIVLTTVYLTSGWATTGRSYGAGLIGVRVLSERRQLLGWTRAGIRAVFCVIFPIGLLWAAVSPTRRSIQDILLGSMVIYDWRKDGGMAVIVPITDVRDPGSLL